MPSERPDNLPRRRTIAVYGPARRTVQVKLTRDESRVFVQTHAGGRRKIHRSWPNTGDHRRLAKLWAKTFSETKELPPLPEHITLRDLWTRYSEVQFPKLRPKTQINYALKWRKWELFFGVPFVADDVLGADVDRFVAAQRVVPNQVRAMLTVVKLVYRWGESRDLITRNKVDAYRFEFPKDQRPLEVAEFNPDEWARILRQLRPARALDWRAWVALTIIGEQGPRASAVLHLRWEDCGADITWQGAHDKGGKTWQQPIRAGTKRALEVAFAHRPKKYSPWVLPGRNPDRPYTIQALWYKLREAEAAAGVPHRAYRAMHGGRRKVVGDAFGVTGSLELAGEFVGQQDVKSTRGYVRDRGRRQLIADALDRHAGASGAQPAEPEEHAGVGPAASSARATGANRTHDHSGSKPSAGDVNHRNSKAFQGRPGHRKGRK